MLINFSVSNYLSFKGKQSFSMISQSYEQEFFIEDHILKSSILFGANAAGKSNLISAIGLFREIILSANKELEKNILDQVIPFLLDNKSKEQPTEFEITFLAENDLLYKYGIKVSNGLIFREWLYFSNNEIKLNEVELFQREGNKLTYINEELFPEAKNFYNEEKYLIQTKENVPFITDMAGTSSKHSLAIINWLKKLQILSGLNDDDFIQYSLKLLEKNKDFSIWIQEFLSSVNINKIKFVDKEVVLEEKVKAINSLIQLVDKIDKDKLSKEQEHNLMVLSKLTDFLNVVNSQNKKNTASTHEKIVEVIKNIDGDEYHIPLHLESSGTKKLIALLGPIFDSIEKNHVLVIDEIDAKFHTLLMKKFFSIFLRDTKKCQLIATAQDTNLISKDIFNRDQIWFVNKDEFGESELYSLIEFKESALSDESYETRYLKGAFGAVPLFPDYATIENLME